MPDLHKINKILILSCVHSSWSATPWRPVNYISACVLAASKDFTRSKSYLEILSAISDQCICCAVHQKSLLAFNVNSIISNFEGEQHHTT